MLGWVYEQKGDLPRSIAELKKRLSTPNIILPNQWPLWAAPMR